MIKRRTVKIEPNPTFAHTPEIKVNGFAVTPGTEVKVVGLRGRWRYLGHTRNVETGAEWVDVRQVNGSTGRTLTGTRSVRPDRIAVVHRTRKVAS